MKCPLPKREIGEFRPTGIISEHLSQKEIEVALVQALVKKFPQNKVVYTPSAMQERLKKISEALAQAPQPQAKTA